MADLHLDCKNMNCPMPLVEVSKAIRGLSSGQSIEVEATDPAFEADMKAWIQHVGHVLETFEGGGSVKRAVIRKVGS